MNNICICCQTNPVNPMISPNFCSRICQELWLREDLKFTNPDMMRTIALAHLLAYNKLEKGK